MVFLLAVEGDEPLAELAQLARRRRPPVDSRRASLADLAPENDPIECSLDGGAVRPVPDLVGAAARPKGQAQRVDDQRLAAARLAGEKVEARAEADGRLRDQGEVANLQLLQHGATSSGPAVCPIPACRPAADRSSPAG